MEEVRLEMVLHTNISLSCRKAPPFPFGGAAPLPVSFHAVTRMNEPGSLKLQ